MAFEYGCFISYRHLPGIEEFVRRLKQDIERELGYYDPLLQVFLDEDRIKPGDHFNALIPTSLCKSIVMIVVYVPTYFHDQKPYCAKEFAAFIEIEKKRLDELAQKQPLVDQAQLRQVIPIILRRNPPAQPLPPELCEGDYIDWTDTMALDNPGRFAKTKEYIKVKRSICDKIIQIWSLKLQLDATANCHQYDKLPDEHHPLVQRLLRPQIPPFPV